MREGGAAVFGQADEGGALNPKAAARSLEAAHGQAPNVHLLFQLPANQLILHGKGAGLGPHCGLRERAMGLPGLRVKEATDAILELDHQERVREELRRQQAQFAQTRRELDVQNSWMAIPALAPAAAVMGLEGAAAIAARLAPAAVAQTPLLLTQRMPHLRVGDNWATRLGRRAHKFYEGMAREKPGWDPGPKLHRAGQAPLKPDIGAPARGMNPDVRRYIEVKPNTPSGRAAAARQIRKYKEWTEGEVRALFYDPERFR